MAEPARHFTAKTLAEYWCCSVQHIYNEMKDGRLSYFKSGKRKIIRKSDVENYECQNSSNMNGLQTGSLDTETVVEATERFQRAQAIRDMPKP